MNPTLLERLAEMTAASRKPPGPPRLTVMRLLERHSASFIIRRCYKDGRMFVNHEGRRKQYVPTRIFLHELRKYAQRREITTLKGLNGIECVVSWIRPTCPSYWFRTL